MYSINKYIYIYIYIYKYIFLYLRILIYINVVNVIEVKVKGIIHNLFNVAVFHQQVKYRSPPVCSWFICKHAGLPNPYIMALPPNVCLVLCVNRGLAVMVILRRQLRQNVATYTCIDYH